MNFEPPFCLAFTVTLPTDTPAFLLASMDPGFVGPVDSFLSISSNEITFSSGGQTVTFGPDGGGSFVSPGSDYVHLQLCVTTNDQAILYVNCERLAERVFATSNRISTALLTFFQNSTVDGGGMFTVSVTTLLPHILEHCC